MLTKLLTKITMIYLIFLVNS